MRRSLFFHPNENISRESDKKAHRQGIFLVVHVTNITFFLIMHFNVTFGSVYIINYKKNLIISYKIHAKD
jgi:hypothetical protein